MNKIELQNVRGGYSFALEIIGFVLKTIIRYVKWI